MLIRFKLFVIRTRTPRRFLDELDALCKKYEVKKERASFEFDYE